MPSNGRPLEEDVPSKGQAFSELHWVISRKRALFIVTVMRTSNPAELIQQLN
jgi:hypothetical protein